MARFNLRDVVFNAMHQRLQDAFPELSGFRAIERNPANPIASDDPLPCLRCFDGGHVNAGSEIIGETTYRMAWRVEGCVGTDTASQAGELDTEMNDLHARIVEATITNGALISIELADGWLQIQSEDTEFDPIRHGVETSEFPTITFTQDFSLSIEVQRGTGFFEPA